MMTLTPEWAAIVLVLIPMVAGATAWYIKSVVSAIVDKAIKPMAFDVHKVKNEMLILRFNQRELAKRMGLSETEVVMTIDDLKPYLEVQDD